MFQFWAIGTQTDDFVIGTTNSDSIVCPTSSQIQWKWFRYEIDAYQTTETLNLECMT